MLNPDIPTISYGDISAAGAPMAQWDALPSAAKIQILGFIGFLELWSESSVALEMDGQAHYVRGGKPGFYPSFQPIRDSLGQPPFDLFDPFGFQSRGLKPFPAGPDMTTPEAKERGLLVELNNGRLAMIGIMGCISASKGLIVPGLDTLPIKPYAGEPMAFFSSVNADLPFVSGMLNSELPWNTWAN